MSRKKKKKELSLEMKKGEEKSPYRLYYFHLNCKHLFGCKANGTFISAPKIWSNYVNTNVWQSGAVLRCYDFESCKAEALGTEAG